ncbi:hypothetical protein BDN67DRAFT_972161 [Paxillus ammoniavirescens]|nr:hypothetical protein BDN67DRAFT_972161 [Paxillus ammoniavirescens]
MESYTIVLPRNCREKRRERKRGQVAPKKVRKRNMNLTECSGDQTGEDRVLEKWWEGVLQIADDR